MKKVFLLSLLVLMPLSSVASDTIIDPVGFEQIWLQNNQRNLFKRYHHHGERVRRGADYYYLIGVDAAADKKIQTSAGVKDALISRLNIHYQTRDYLFLIDWFSAIPQPQTTEGFTYGDLVLGKTWESSDTRSCLTLGLRQQSTPRSTVVGTDVVFDAVSDATKEKYSIFFHLNYQGFDLGSYYSEDNKLESSAFHMPILRSENQSLSSTLFYYGSNIEAKLAKRYELSTEHLFHRSEHSTRIGLTFAALPDLNKYEISNIFINYSSPFLSGIRFTGGVFYYLDIENNESLPGAKLGLEWALDHSDAMRLGFSIQKNSIGDINALIIRDEPIFSFTLSSGFGE